MSTRCTVEVKTPRNGSLFLYRHHDGYLAATGRDVARCLGKLYRLPISFDKASNVALRFVGLLASESESHGVDACGVYELTSGHHGDTEYHYIVNFAYREISCEVWTRGPGDDWLTLYRGDVDGFRVRVAQSTRDRWNRVRAYRRRIAAAS